MNTTNAKPFGTDLATATDAAKSMSLRTRGPVTLIQTGPETFAYYMTSRSPGVVVAIYRQGVSVTK